MIRRNALLFACLLAATGAQAATQAEIDGARAKGLAWLVKNQEGDGSWYTHEALKVQSTASALEALLNAGMRYGETYGAGVAWLANAPAPSTDSLARKIHALSLAGQAPTGSELLGWRNEGSNWGAYAQHETSLVDTGLALAGVVSVDPSFVGFGQCALLKGQSSVDGGWPNSLPPQGAPGYMGQTALMPTTFLILGFKRYVDAGDWLSQTCTVNGVDTVYTYSTVLDAAVAGLAAKQHADGGFGENSVSTPLETALAYLAIQAVNPSHSALSAAQNYLLTGAGKPGADGSWGGDPLATAMALQSLPAANLPDTDGDGVPDVVETALANGSSTSVADGRAAAAGNGLGEVGINTPLILPAAMVGQAYSHSLGQSGLSAFGLNSGSLPPGLSLTTAGLIAGTPSQSGAFSFQYAASPSFAQLAQLTVGEEVSDGDVPTLPEWGMLLLGAGLLVSLLRRASTTQPA